MYLTYGLLQGNFGIAKLLTQQADTLSVRSQEAKPQVGTSGKHPVVERAGKLHGL